MDQAARAHDVWMTLAQVVPVVGLAFGVLVTDRAKARLRRPIPRGDHIYFSTVYGTIGLLLVVAWFVAINSLTNPSEFTDNVPQLFTLGVTIAGGALIVIPIAEYIAATPKRKRGDHEAATEVDTGTGTGTGTE